MSWFDLVIVIVALAGLFAGRRLGLLSAVFYVASVLTALFLAANLSGGIAGWFTDRGADDAIATALAYLVIFAGVFTGALLAEHLTRAAIKLTFLGWVESLGSIAAGLLLGLALAGVLILGAARFSSDIPTNGDDGAVIKTTGFRGSLQKALAFSMFTGVFINVTDRLPGSALGFVPGDYKIALEQLDKLAEQEAAQ